MQPFDQEHFAEYIRKRNLAHEPHIPFYVKWVKRFLATPFPPTATSPDDRLKVFADLLHQDQSLQDWQCRQAFKAVELYLKVFSSPSEEYASGASHIGKEATVEAAEKAYADMRELIWLPGPVILLPARPFQDASIQSFLLGCRHDERHGEAGGGAVGREGDPCG
jgi:hypothetical protein